MEKSGCELKPIKQKRTNDQTQGKDSDANTAWIETRENEKQEPETANNTRVQTDWDKNDWEWWSGNNYWAGNQGGGQNPGPPAK